MLNLNYLLHFLIGGGRIGVYQNRDEDTSTMAQGTHLHLICKFGVIMVKCLTQEHNMLATVGFELTTLRL